MAAHPTSSRATSQLVPIVEGALWEAHHLLSMPMPGCHFDCRMSVLRLQDDTLMIHSPILIDDALAGFIDALGEVSALLAPNLFHHLFFAQAAARYPTAKRFGAPGLKDKRPDLSFDHELSSKHLGALPEGVCGYAIEGMPKINEVLLYHPLSQALILTDLLFNIERPQGLTTPMLLRLMGTHKRLAKSRLASLLTQDEAAYRRSIAPLEEIPFERLLMAHGELIEEDARARALKALGL